MGYSWGGPSGGVDEAGRPFRFEDVLDCTMAGCSRKIWEGGPYCRRHAGDNMTEADFAKSSPGPKPVPFSPEADKDGA